MSTKPSDRVSRVRASRARRNAGSRLENMCTEGPQPSINAVKRPRTLMDFSPTITALHRQKRRSLIAKRRFLITGKSSAYGI